jgi:hypothetical protein
MLLDILSRRAERLEASAVKSHLDVLEAAGCSRQILTLYVGLIESLPQLSAQWTKRFGSLEERRTLSRNLADTASRLEAISMRGTQSISTTEASRATRTDWIPDEVIGDVANAIHPELGQFSAERMIGTLRFYSNMLTLPERLLHDQDWPFEHVLRYALSALVERATGSPHDASVAALLAYAIPGSGGYTADAHRKWRERNAELLEQQFFPAVDLLASAAETLRKMETAGRSTAGDTPQFKP